MVVILLVIYHRMRFIIISLYIFFPYNEGGIGGSVQITVSLLKKKNKIEESFVFSCGRYEIFLFSSFICWIVLSQLY